MPQSEFDQFCRFAFAFLDDRDVRYLVVGGLAVMVVGEPRMTADADAVVFISTAEAETLTQQAAESGFDRTARPVAPGANAAADLRTRGGHGPLEPAAAGARDSALTGTACPPT